MPDLTSYLAHATHDGVIGVYSPFLPLALRNQAAHLQGREELLLGDAAEFKKG